MVDDSALGVVRMIWDANARAMRPPQPSTDAGFQFVKGPLPFKWFAEAGRLPGKALHVALGLWMMRGILGRSSFQLKRKAASAFGASPDATYDALKNLEAAGLIVVVRHPGRSPIVTIVDSPALGVRS